MTIYENKFGRVVAGPCPRGAYPWPVHESRQQIHLVCAEEVNVEPLALAWIASMERAGGHHSRAKSSKFKPFPVPMFKRKTQTTEEP
jgi:hypothetical protein